MPELSCWRREPTLFYSQERTEVAVYRQESIVELDAHVPVLMCISWQLWLYRMLR